MQAWGSMAAGDSVSMELWRGSGNINDDMESISWDLTNGNPSQAAGQWTNLSWDPQVTWQQIPGLAYPEIFLGGNSYTFSVLFTSDSSSASEGFHVDDLVQFGVSKVTDYTLDLSCDNPTGGYTVAPNQLAVLHCSLTNNGYAPATIRLQSNVTNDSWMAPYPVIRIDVEDSNNHNINQVMSPLGGGKTIEFWANLSVPAGADVQQQTWNLWLTDASSAALGEKARIDMDLAVSEQFSVSLTSSVGLVAGTIAPSEYGLVEFKLLNAGNRDAAFNLNTNFASENPGWSAVVQNETGVIIPNPIVLGRGTYEDLVLNITAPDDAAPGTVPFNLMATCPSCSTTLFGTDRLSRNIEVPVLRTVVLETEDYELEAAANGVQKVAYISIFNLGNDDEQYDLSIEQSNWRLEASLAATQSPVLDAWDGEATFVLNLPMPIGLSPGLYNVRVIATNVDDPLVRTHIDIGIDILATSAVAVSNEVPGQSYIPGDLPQTMKFEVFNNGNRADSFAMSFGLPEGMQASYTNLMTGDITPEIAVGASYNVTVQFSFLDGASGDLTLQVIATSTADSSVSSSGTATYLVGSQNWLKIYAVQPLEISEEGEYEIEIRIRNQYTSAQYVAMELDDSNTKSWFQTKIESQLDRNFALQKDEERTITVTVDVSATTLKSLSNESLVTTLTVWARSETVSDAAQQTIQLTLLKTDTSSSTTTQDDSSSSLDVATIGMWVIFLLIIGIGAVVLFNIVTTVEEEDEYKDWDQEYEDSLVASYGAVAAAPTVPMVSTPSLASAAAPPAQSSAPVAAPVAQGPPVPAAGLPAGWTMEQWEVYGQQWLDSQS